MKLRARSAKDHKGNDIWFIVTDGHNGKERLIAELGDVNEEGEKLAKMLAAAPALREALSNMLRVWYFQNTTEFDEARKKAQDALVLVTRKVNDD